MKKFLSVVVVCMMLFTMSVSVFADEAVVVAPSTTQNEDGSWTTAGEDASYAGKMMTILVYSGTTPSVDSIQYIDQTTADSTTGAYSFAKYLPKVDPTGETEYVVKVGGQTLASPLSAGTIKAAVTGAKFAGSVTFDGAATGATITLTPADGEATVITTETDGTFDATVNKGTYTLVVSKLGHTTYTYNGFVVSEDAENLSYTIYGGDANNSGGIEVGDLSKIIDNFKAAVSTESSDEVKACDVNESGGVEVGDLSKIIDNFKKGNVVLPEPTPEA